MGVWKGTICHSDGGLIPLQGAETHLVLVVQTGLVSAVVLVDQENIKPYVYCYHC